MALCLRVLIRYSPACFFQEHLPVGLWGLRLQSLNFRVVSRLESESCGSRAPGVAKPPGSTAHREKPNPIRIQGPERAVYVRKPKFSSFYFRPCGLIAKISKTRKMASRPQLGFKSRIFRNRYLQPFSAVGAKASLRAAADGPLEGAVKPKDPALPAGFAQSPAVLFSPPKIRKRRMRLFSARLSMKSVLEN